MRTGVQVGAAMVMALWAMSATAGESWETVMDGPLTIKTREVEGGGVHEYLVETELDASVVDLQATLNDPERFPKFMPHVSETRVLDHEGNTDRVYTRIDPPVGGARDYITEVKVLQTARPDGTGTFHQVWHATPEAIPERSGITRVKLNEGSWVITGNDDGSSKVVYRFRVDPGGWVPDFIAELANKKAIPDTIHAIEKEAQRRARARSRTAQAQEARPGEAQPVQ